MKTARLRGGHSSAGPLLGLLVFAIVPLAVGIGLLAFPFLTVGLVFSGMLIIAFFVPDTRKDAGSGTDPARVEGDRFRASPPRKIPLAARIAVIAGPLGSQIAWFFLVGFVFVFVIMDGPASWSRLFRLTVDQETVTGRVIDVRQLESYELSVPVYQYQIEYEAAGGTHRGSSYTRGRKYGTGDEVPIVFDAGRPERGTIAGARVSELTWWHSAIPLGVVVLLVVGLVGMYRHGLRVAWLLRHGVRTTARRFSAGSGRAADDDPVEDGVATMVTRHAFEVRGGRFLAKRYSPANKKIDDDEVAILYNPRRPKQNVILSEHLAETMATSRSTATLMVQCAAGPLSLIGIYLLLRGGELL